MDCDLDVLLMLFQDNQVHSMTADDFTPCITKPSAVMALYMQNKEAFVTLDNGI